jgi:hypothetical protein
MKYIHYSTKITKSKLSISCSILLNNCHISNGKNININFGYTDVLFKFSWENAYIAENYVNACKCYTKMKHFLLQRINVALLLGKGKL